ncbi:MAG: Stk1 family PASTA domain-containing Ser/Thr kinase [Propionibacteriaceae bacterium]|jgi:serine/threonine-protein kinase|nr:Stk1 family PASTA domain-containing Ser/Thr kinase [Propionibacteriaceae bacterium]
MTQPMMLGDRYRLEEVIGRGGMAEVWRAQDTRLGREVAIKRLRTDLSSDPTFQARFQREAQSAAGLNHPNIVSVYDTGTQIDPNSGISIPFIVMELVKGETLRDVLHQDEPITPKQAFEYLTGVLSALSFSHSKGIIHRDIKPANVMITTDGVVKVMDFGIARAVSDTTATMTQTAAVIGTAQYLSPEQARGETVDARSDIYSTGCLLYELLTGRPPFTGDSPVSVAYQHVREVPLPPSQLEPLVTPAMDAIVMTALAKDPATRYQSADDMLADVNRLLGGTPVQAKVPDEAETQLLPPPPGPRLTASDDTETKLMSDSALAAFGSEEVDEEDAYYSDDQPRRRVTWPTMVLIGLLVVLFAALGMVLLKTWGTETDQTTVPSVIGLNETGAKSTLSNHQLTAEVRHTSGPADTKGEVIKQDPAQGATARIGSTVIITINDGPNQATIPTSIIGMPEDQAKRELVALGFNANFIFSQPATSEPPSYVSGQIVSVTPAPGQMANFKDQITLTVATGMSIVPQLVGMSEGDAIAAASALGFSAFATGFEPTDEVPPGTVLRQSAQYGIAGKRTDPIRLTVSVAAPPSSAPTETAAPPTNTTVPTDTSTTVPTDTGTP